MARVQRVEELLRREIANILLFKLDRSRFSLVSITRVQVTKDLRNARVFYSQLGSEQDIKRTHRHLIQTAGYIKGELGKAIDMRTTPNLTFVYDEQLAKATELVNKINRLNDTHS